MSTHDTCQRPPATTIVFGFEARATLPRDIVNGSGF
jgi:hypothetical protein